MPGVAFKRATKTAVKPGRKPTPTLRRKPKLMSKRLYKAVMNDSKKVKRKK